MRLRRRQRHAEVVELNITAFMNLMVILVPFLLITTVFSRMAILELNLPDKPGEGDVPPRQHRRGRLPGLNLVSLMDIFTILVFFLLVNSSDTSSLQGNKDLQLPISTASARRVRPWW